MCNWIIVNGRRKRRESASIYIICRSCVSYFYVFNIWLVGRSKVEDRCSGDHRRRPVRAQYNIYTRALPPEQQQQQQQYTAEWWCARASAANDAEKYALCSSRTMFPRVSYARTVRFRSCSRDVCRNILWRGGDECFWKTILTPHPRGVI